ncbi:MAG: helix-turn-helix transcriptional regulator [Ruminococcus sp.]|nr:helix-turn-helix transcriptional regulator [Ruminococcus sp.]
MLRLTELRKNTGKSMAQAARELNIPYTTYVNYEKGVREPNAEGLVQLARYYRCSVDYLLGNTDVMQLPDDNGKNRLRYAAYSELEGESDEVALEVLRFIQFMKGRGKGEEKQK